MLFHFKLHDVVTATRSRGVTVGLVCFGKSTPKSKISIGYHLKWFVALNGTLSVPGIYLLKKAILESWDFVKLKNLDTNNSIKFSFHVFPPISLCHSHLQKGCQTS